jgi:hypothetical protein
MASSVDRRIEEYLSEDMGHCDPESLIRPRFTEPIGACGRVPRQQAGHVTASGFRLQHADFSLRAGGHPHMSSGRPKTGPVGRPMAPWSPCCGRSPRRDVELDDLQVVGVARRLA